MANFKIVSDSSCDFEPNLAKEQDITLIPFYITLDGTNYFKEGVDLQKDEFYKRLVTENAYPKTSLPSPQDYIDAYRPILESGFDIFSLTITSKFSGSYQSAHTAANTLLEEFPDRKISIVDSFQVAFGQNLILWEAIARRNGGVSLEQTTKDIKTMSESSVLFFTLETLEYLKKGGRIGKGAALIGGVLGLKPVLQLKDGELHPRSKVRGKKKAIANVIDHALEYIGNNKDDYLFVVGHTANPTESEAFRKELEENHGIKTSYPLINAGATIGSHIGPGGVGVAIVKKIK